jgi:hypothetical protein
LFTWYFRNVHFILSLKTHQKIIDFSYHRNFCHKFISVFLKCGLVLETFKKLAGSDWSTFKFTFVLSAIQTSIFQLNEEVDTFLKVVDIANFCHKFISVFLKCGLVLETEKVNFSVNLWWRHIYLLSVNTQLVHFHLIIRYHI